MEMIVQFFMGDWGVNSLSVLSYVQIKLVNGYIL